MLSWVDLVSSVIIAISIGTAFLISAFLPEQLTPMMQWVVQWGGYILTKAVFSLPGIIVSFGAILLAIGALIAGGKGMQNLVKFAKERRNVLSLL